MRKINKIILVALSVIVLVWIGKTIDRKIVPELVESKTYEQKAKEFEKELAVWVTNAELETYKSEQDIEIYGMISGTHYYVLRWEKDENGEIYWVPAIYLKSSVIDMLLGKMKISTHEEYEFKKRYFNECTNHKLEDYFLGIVGARCSILDLSQESFDADDPIEMQKFELVKSEEALVEWLYEREKWNKQTCSGKPPLTEKEKRVLERRRHKIISEQ